MGVRKVSDLPYRRYTVEEGREAFARFRAAALTATSAEQMLAAHETAKDLFRAYSTAAALAECRYTCNTKDAFYEGEKAYYDEVGPLFSELDVAYADIMLSSPFRAELETRINPRIFRKFEIAKKAFDPATVADCQEENAVSTEYTKLMAEMKFRFDGKEMPLSVLCGKLDDSDRNVRARAADAIGVGMSAHRAELDGIFDRLVKIRDRIAKKMGYRDFVELGYYRMGRMDYDADMVARFRENVKDGLVPVVSALKRRVAQELGIDRTMLYDDGIYAPGEVPHPVLDKEGLFREAQAMYDEMDPEVGAFMREMREAEAFDVDSRDGKWGGGYCTEFPLFRQPFILANFNGSADDVDVITHEFGHAYASHCMFESGDEELNVGGMETAECHSMSMEFFCWRGTERFFGSMANAYRKKHLLGALSFLPYGVIVDEFQHEIYAHPEYTPAERNRLWLRLEHKYRPYLSYEGIPYLEEGTRWQYQMHIYESPFYYIDYCLAQTVALQFLFASRKDYGRAFSTYREFVRAGGQKAFPTLVADAGFPSPFAPGALDGMARDVLALETVLSE